ncbi:MAG: hypothetical protein ACLRX9_03170 [Streptococcus salivarius]
MVLTFTEFVQRKMTFQVHSSSTLVLTKINSLTMVKRQLRFLLTMK